MTEQASQRERPPLPPVQRQEFGGDFWRAVALQAANERHPNENQDVIAVREKLGLFILCDGMGGHEGGRTAAETVASAVAEHLEHAGTGSDNPDSIESTARSLVAAVRSSQARLLDVRGKEGKSDTTVTAALVRRFPGRGTAVIVGHVGDSRAYAVMPHGEVRQLTEDHDLLSMPDGARLILGDLSPEEIARRRPEVRREMAEARSVEEMSEPARMLFNYRHHTMGVGDKNMHVDVDVYRFPEGGRIVLMSDGVYENLGGRRTGAALSLSSSQDIAEAAGAILQEAQQNGHFRPKSIPTAHPDDMSILFIEGP